MHERKRQDAGRPTMQQGQWEAYSGQVHASRRKVGDRFHILLNGVLARGLRADGLREHAPALQFVEDALGGRFEIGWT